MTRSRSPFRHLIAAMGGAFGSDVVLIRSRIAAELPPGQASIARALLVDGPEFAPPERPVTYAIIAAALGISVSSVATQLRRIRRRHPSLWALLWTERQRRLALWRAEAAAARRERARRWGKRRWAARHRREHGVWPWDDCGHTRR